MTDELCDKCGIGFFLPSGRCAYCNCMEELAEIRALLTPEEKATHAKWEREAKSAELQRVIEARGLVDKYKDVDTSQADIPYAKGGFNAPTAWTSVKDRLPEQGVKVLVSESDTVYIAKLDGGMWEFDDGERIGVTLSEVIAWQPLPELPKGDV